MTRVAGLVAALGIALAALIGLPAAAQADSGNADHVACDAQCHT